jgi:katanin p60 ATPase-containing subunit A1
MPVDLSASIYAEYKRARKRAEEAERRGAQKEAAAAYQQAATLMRKYASYTFDKEVRQSRLQRATVHEAAAVRLRHTKASPALRPLQENARQSGQGGQASGDEDDLEAAVLALIERTTVSWDDIGGLEETKTTIKSAYGLALARKPQGVSIEGLRNLLLFGPPGTGKTLLAAATAGSLDATFFNVKASSLLSKYFGESTKLISTLYAVAGRMAPAVVYMDEFESLTPARGMGESGAERRIVSTLLAELDGLAGKDDDRFILTMGATNLPWTLDTAILSRFQRRIYIPLPDEAARDAIFEIHIERRGHASQVERSELVGRTEGFSGREIEQLCEAAVDRMIRRSNPDLESVVDRGQEAVRGHELHVEPLNAKDFDTAFGQVHPIADERMLQRYAEWEKQAAG